MSHSDWLDIDILEDYLDGNLDAKTMHSIEKISLEDPFVAEALAGLSESRKRTQSLSLLQKQLQERVAQKPVVEKRWRMTSQRLSIGAAAAVLFVVVSILFWMKQVPKKAEISKRNKVEIQIAPQVAAEQNPSLSTEIAPLVKEIKPKAPVENKVSATSTAGKAQVSMAVVSATPTTIVASVSVDSAKAVKSAVSGDVQMVALSRKANTTNEQAARETPLSGKAEDVRFSPNELLKGKPGVLINGVVYEKPGGQPLPGAVISVAGTNKSAITNANGEFSLPADSGAQSLSVGYLGFSSKNVLATAGQPVNIGLQADKNTLNEVVVADKSKAIRPIPVPSNGWNDFNAYLVANNRLAQRETKSTRQVKVTFNVEKDGRPSNIKISKGLGKAENTEAIRLIQEGPNWVLPFNASRKAEVVINF